MNRCLFRVLLGAAAAVGGVILLGFALPETSVVRRSDEIAAPPATVYELLTDLRATRRWSPWRNARARYLFSGPALGVGARMDWSGAGRGSVVVEEAAAYARVVQRIELDGRPWRGAYLLTRSAAGTRLVWSMETAVGSNPLARWNAYWSSQGLRETLERGLEKLGDVAEALPHADMEAGKVRLIQAPARRFAYVEGRTQGDPEAIARTLAASRARVAAALRAGGATPISGPIWIPLAGGDTESVAYRAGSAFEGGAPRGADGVFIGRLEGGPMVQAEHRGSPEALPEAEAAARLYLGIHQLPPSGPPVIEFSADPVAASADKLSVVLRLPVSLTQ